MHEDIILIQKDVSYIKKQLDGNGDKGLIYKVRELEMWKWGITGGLILLGSLLSYGLITEFV